MPDGGGFAEFVDQARGAKLPGDLLTPLRHEIERLGFPRVIYQSIRPFAPEPLFVTNYPSEWVKHYIDQRYKFYDPVTNYARKATTPYLWEDSYRGRRLTRQEAEVMNVAGEFGMRSGGVIPLCSPGGAGWAYLCVNSGLSQIEFAKLFAETAPKLMLLASYLHEAFPPTAAGEEESAERRLTLREADILSWMAVGKTREQAARLMRISDHTAKDHLRRACRRLGASNTTHAVAIAVSRGLLRL